MKNLRFSYDSKRLMLGAVFVVLGVLLPFVINERSFGIYHSLFDTLSFDKPLFLLITATKLVLMNCLRALPHYMGAFIISESLSLFRGTRRMFAFNTVTTFGIVWLTYQVIWLIHPIRLDFGTPAIISVSFVLLLSYMNLFSINIINKFIIVFTLLLSLQWLDLVPPLSSYGFGRGEISVDIKSVSTFMELGGLLTWYAMSMFLAFLICSAIQVQLLYKEHRLKYTTIKNQEVEQNLITAQMNALRMRTFGEVQSLVHDLKTPLTTIQGLVTLAEMMEQNPKISEYLSKISQSATNMSSNISEILYEDRRSLFTIDDLMKSVLSQVSINIPSSMLSYQNDCKSAAVYGNRIHLSRAIINPIDNARQALDPTGGKISIHVYKQPGSNIAIDISDNGRGIAHTAIERIWEPGFSGNQSTGLGLSYTRKVIEDHSGTISAKSRENEYTCIQICLREATEHAQY